jgi:nicotinate-nucleotide pyrophosphorylase
MFGHNSMTPQVSHGVCDGEALGNMALAHIAGVAATGVDCISVGALIRSAPVLDLGLDHAA